MNKTTPNNLEEWLSEKTYSIVAIDKDIPKPTNLNNNGRLHDSYLKVDNYIQEYKYSKDWRN